MCNMKPYVLHPFTLLYSIRYIVLYSISIVYLRSIRFVCTFPFTCFNLYINFELYINTFILSLCTSKMIYHQGASLSEHALLFCHGTQTIDNSRICHCLLFHRDGNQNFMQPFLRSRKLLRYTHAWTKLHNVVMTQLNLIIIIILLNTRQNRRKRSTL